MEFEPASKKTIEEHKRDGTYRPHRHNPFVGLSAYSQRLKVGPEPFGFKDNGSCHGWPGRRELAFLTGVTERTICRWIAAGKVPAPSMTIGTCREIWHPKIVDKWIAHGMPDAATFDKLIDEASEEND